MLHFLDPLFLIQTLGLIGVFAIVFAESGLLIGFIFPGDSLLFTAGFLASQELLPIGWLLLGCFIAAVVGDNVGYAFGRRVGPRIFTKEDSLFFHKKHLIRAQMFYEKKGPWAVVMARFMPVIRTFAPILAGVGQMHYRTFLVYNILGGFLWAVGITLLGYFLGSIIPGVDQYLLPIVLVIIFISFLPGILEYFKYRRESKTNIS